MMNLCLTEIHECIERNPQIKGLYPVGSVSIFKQGKGLIVGISPGIIRLREQESTQFRVRAKAHLFTAGVGLKVG